jgi:hypothetical protein
MDEETDARNGQRHRQGEGIKEQREGEADGSCVQPGENIDTHRPLGGWQGKVHRQQIERRKESPCHRPTSDEPDESLRQPSPPKPIDDEPCQRKRQQQQNRRPIFHRPLQNRPSHRFLRPCHHPSPFRCKVGTIGLSWQIAVVADRCRG